MNKEVTIKISGEAGQGMHTIGMALTKILKNSGAYIFANLDYMSRIRGGNNFFQIRVSDVPLYALRQKADIVVCLDKPSVDLEKDGVNKDGVVVFDKEEFKLEKDGAPFFDVPFYRIAKELGGSELYINSVACGLVIGFVGLKFDYIEMELRSVFSKKGDEVIKKNLEAAKAGYMFAKDNFKKEIFRIDDKEKREELILNGNEAIGLGALAAGCKFYSAYPMTPSTSIMNVVAHYAQQYGVIVEQAEDEIAAINMAIGASFAGARSMTATSGGGFALMCEGLSLAAMTETPIVIVDAQRPAPATGLPTRTEQGDLEFLLHAGHGEFARVIYAPGTIEECFYLTMKAFNLAEKYQIPVLIMTDQHLADAIRNVPMLDTRRVPIERHIISKDESSAIADYKRYQLTDSGVSPRAIPSWINDVIYADSDEHTEAGHITEDGNVRVQMVQKRFHKKMHGLSAEAVEPVAGNLEDAKLVLIGFGSTFGVLNETSKAEKGIGFIHLPQVWPLPLSKLASYDLSGKRLVTVENNSTAQLARLIKRESDIRIDGSILRYDGRPMDLDFLLGQVKEGEKL